MSERRYLINEIYYALHGEGVRYGMPHVFVRFAGCNLTCGFCDTEFESGTEMTAVEILTECHRLTEANDCRNVLFSGGEPLLQLDLDLLSEFKARGWFTCVETNGTKKIPKLIDWAACSPKVAEHALEPTFVNELKYVRGYKQGIPKPAIKADHYLISPRFEGDTLEPRTLDWCVELVKAHPQWRLTIQHHKLNSTSLFER